jgi:uncharacterized protein
MLIILGYLASIIMGLVLGMIGGGGSILTVPILVYLFQLDPMMATAYSLFIVGITAFVGAFKSYQAGMLDFKTGFIFALPSFVGVYLVRAYLMPRLPNKIFESGDFVLTKALLIMIVFAVLMVISSFMMIKKKSEIKKSEMSAQLKTFVIGIEGLLVGGITGFVGAGGGFLIIPALVILVGLPMKIAVGTSLGIITAKSLLGFIGDLQAGLVLDWSILGGASLLAGVGILIGSRLSQSIPEAQLKKGFGYFVLIMGSGILLDQLFKMT